MFIGDSATAAFPARGAVFFRACGVPAARVGAAVSVRRAKPGKALQCPAKQGNARQCPEAPRTAKRQSKIPPQPSDVHGAARKLPDVKNIFI